MSMQASSKKKKKKKNRQTASRHGIMLIAIIAAMILVVNLVVFSYSWFKPADPVQAKGMYMDLNATIRSEKCTFETYQGTLVTDANWVSGGYKAAGYYIDQVAYSNTAILKNEVITIPVATTDSETGELIPGRVYFRTNVQNTDTKHPSVISLYHHLFPGDLGLAVTYPSNTYFINDFGTEADGSYPDCFILRNAYVKVKDAADVDGPGLLQVEWFVENFSTTATKSIRVTLQDQGVETPIQWLYLMYN